MRPANSMQSCDIIKATIGYYSQGLQFRYFSPQEMLAECAGNVLYKFQTIDGDLVLAEQLGRAVGPFKLLASKHLQFFRRFCSMV